jgi:hypothetical protein
MVLKPGYIAPKPVTSSLTREKGMFKSSRYIRLLVSCFVASYPFFIPPYVSVFADAILIVELTDILKYIPQYGTYILLEDQDVRSS